MDPLAQYNEQAPLAAAAPQQPAAPMPLAPAPMPAPTMPLPPQPPVGHPTHEAHHQHQQPGELPSMEGVTALHKPWIAIFSVIILIIVAIGSFTLYVLNVRTSSQTKEAQARSTELTAKIAAEPLRTVEKQAHAIAAALDGYRAARAKQLDLGLLNQQVRDLMPKNVIVDSLTMDKSGKARIEVQSDTFIDSGKLLLSFQGSPLFVSADLETAALEKKEGQKPTTAVIIGTVNTSYLQTNNSDTQS